MFVYGEFDESNSDQITEKIGSEIQPIVESDQIKFIYGNGSAVFHFESELKFEEMSIYCDILFEEFQDFMYILVPFNNKIHSNADDDRIDHLLTINGENKKPNKNIINFDGFKANEEAMYEMFINLINVGDFYGNPSPTYEDDCYMSLDEILDKINETGIKSLTESELKKLEEYSKQK